MHPYATDSKERRLVPCLIALLSLIVALAFGELLEHASFKVPWWFDSPAVIGFYSIFFCLFDKFLWKCNIFWKVGLVKVPNLNGVWKGYVSSSFNEHTKKYDTEFTIQQDWNRIRIVGKFAMSKSSSLTASVLVNDYHGVSLCYEYLNQPSSYAVGTMEMHRGFVSLNLNTFRNELSGTYYSGRGRQNMGELKLERV